MTLRLRPWFGLLAVLLCAEAALAQAGPLAEATRPGDHFRYEIALKVEGKMKVDRDGRSEAIPLKAAARHEFFERVEAVDDRGGVGRAVRHYLAAASESEVGVERSHRELSADRRLIVAQRTAAGTVCFSPAGPMVRDELDLVAEHFDTLSLATILPGTDVTPGDTWPLPPATVQHLCLFDGLTRSDLTGKLYEVKDGVATFTITGTAEGVEKGATAKLTVTASGTFDVAGKRVRDLVWEQADERSQGPASPATEIRAVVTLKRTVLAEAPKELSADATAKVPADGKVPDLLTQLRYADAQGRYQFLYSRDWHVVGRTPDHLVLRLLDKGEFTAQATITAWRKADPGKHLAPEEFKKTIGRLPGWLPERVHADGEQPTEPGRWLYRIVAAGKQDGLPVVQSFLMLAGPDGDQAAVTVLVPLERFDKLAARDLALANAIDFPEKR